MKTATIAAILSLGLAPAALAAGGEAAGDTILEDEAAQAAAEDRPDIPAEGEATLADCQIWVSTLGELLEAGETVVAEDVVAEAEEARQQAHEACDAGDYHEGIITAAEAIDRLEGREHGDHAPDADDDADTDDDNGTDG